MDDEEDVKKQLGWTKAVKQEIFEEASSKEKKDEKKEDEKKGRALESRAAQPHAPEPPQQQQQQKACNRRQTAMFLNRLRKNTKRLENLPDSLREKLAKEDDDSVSELITQLMGHGGRLAGAVQQLRAASREGGQQPGADELSSVHGAGTGPEIRRTGERCHEREGTLASTS